MGSFQDLLNRFNNKGVAGPANLVPSQMPGAMGGGFDHGITGIYQIYRTDLLTME